MNIYKKVLLGIAVCVSFTSCNDWLDINIDPNTPTAESSQIQNRLPWCQFYLNHAYQIAGSRVEFGCGAFTSTSRVSRDGCSAQWEPTNSLTTTSYQWFFVGCGSNLADMYEKAIGQGAWHYAGAARLLKSYGFMLMTDLYGEMPYSEALGVNNVPKYDTGKTIFMGCLADIDEAIELFQKKQDATVPSLAEGDSWNGGDVNKWLKMAYLLKARWINNLYKKGEGSYKDGKYDAKEILSCLEKAMTGNNDNTIISHLDANNPTQDVLGWGEPVEYSPLFSVVGGTRNNRVTKTYVNNLTNFGGSGIEDPRADKLIPWSMSHKSANSPTELKWNGNWRRSLGVDMATNIRQEGGPFGLSYNKTTDSWYCNSKDSKRFGDTVYVHMMSGARGYYENKDLLSRMDEKYDGSATSSIFYNRPSSPTYVACYHEACFIKAEVLFHQGNMPGAFDAYKEGIKANIELMNMKLNAWVSEDEGLKKCPSFTPMTDAEINNFLDKGIGNSGNISLGKIMTQKRIAMLYSVQVWNDMRKYDYDPTIFLNWNIPFEYHTNTASLKAIPEGQKWRRWRQCSHELDYNTVNLQEIGNQVPGANMSLPKWNNADDVWSIPVWWDSNQQ